MKKSTTLLLSTLMCLFLIATTSSCEKEDPRKLGCMNSNANNYDPAANVDCVTCCKYNGDVIFWTLFGDNIQYVDVYVDGSLKGRLSNDCYSTPDCGNAGGVTYTGSEGTHTAHCVETDQIGVQTGKKWDFDFQVYGKSCTPKRLYK